ncbi:hypothetical protein BCR44DRAFT_1151818 [Catenaria anguillulae PL171]|uniref:Uncharacterized protein n=1 Tax=Catenaria anguillulae PL171 TaxID=765915 RepID=A0A1Y2H3Z3_9FUNG|nr:hypothetical protein BCR44DRAFT_1151818 [Catenaria anguillulae PL171]
MEQRQAMAVFVGNSLLVDSDEEEEDEAGENELDVEKHDQVPSSTTANRCAKAANSWNRNPFRTRHCSGSMQRSKRLSSVRNTPKSCPHFCPARPVLPQVKPWGSGAIPLSTPHHPIPLFRACSRHQRYGGAMDSIKRLPCSTAHIRQSRSKRRRASARRPAIHPPRWNRDWIHCASDGQCPLDAAVADGRRGQRIAGKATQDGDFPLAAVADQDEMEAGLCKGGWRSGCG